MKKKEKVNLRLLCNGDKEEAKESADYGGRYFIEDYDAEYWSDKVILNGDLFKDLYGTTRNKASDSEKLLSVIKITSKDGKSIHRAFFGKKGISGFNKKDIALTANSIRLLSSDGRPEHIDEVWVSKGNKFCYYWNHPYHATRISMKLGIYSICIAIVLSLLSIFLQFLH